MCPWGLLPCWECALPSTLRGLSEGVLAVSPGDPMVSCVVLCPHGDKATLGLRGVSTAASGHRAGLSFELFALFCRAHDLTHVRLSGLEEERWGCGGHQLQAAPQGQQGGHPNASLPSWVTARAQGWILPALGCLLCGDRVNAHEHALCGARHKGTPTEHIGSPFGCSSRPPDPRQGTGEAGCPGSGLAVDCLCSAPCLGSPQGSPDAQRGCDPPIGAAAASPAAQVTLLLPPQVKEWLCLNCQMQRALGMDMTTAPRSKSRQQLHSPTPSPAHSPAKLPLGRPEQEPPRGASQAETARATAVPGPAPEVGRVPPQTPLPTKPSTAEPRPPAGEALGKSATTVPSGPGAAEQTQEGLTGRLFGLGASLLTQASTLMSVQPEADPQGQPAPSKGPPKIVFSDASKEAGPRPSSSGPGPRPASGAKTEPGTRTGPGLGPGALERTGGATSPKHSRAEQQAVPKASAKPKLPPQGVATCPLCQAELHVGSKGPANFNTCTTCKLQVCNLCGFNPTPHLVEVREPPKCVPLGLDEGA